MLGLNQPTFLYVSQHHVMSNTISHNIIIIIKNEKIILVTLHVKKTLQGHLT